MLNDLNEKCTFYNMDFNQTQPLTIESQTDCLNDRQTIEFNNSGCEPNQSGKRPKHYFTPENAADMAKRGNITRHRNRQLKMEMLKRIQDKLENLDKIELSCDSTDDYLKERVSRTREKILKIENMIDSCTQPKELDQLASALTRLSELERILSGRPLPGSKKPAAERPGKRQITPQE